jgi:hypothetical protein
MYTWQAADEVSVKANAPWQYEYWEK